MAVEQAAGTDRRMVTHLEALGRLIAGIAPYIEVSGDYRDLTLRAIARAVDPASPDFMNFTRDRQPLVDAAFLAQGVLRAPHVLRDRFDDTTRRNLLAALESTRTISPGMRVDYALRQHDQSITPSDRGRSSRRAGE